MQAGIKEGVGRAHRRRMLFIAALTALTLINFWLWMSLASNGAGSAPVETTIAVAAGSIAVVALLLVWRNPMATITTRTVTPSQRFALATHQAGHIVAGFAHDPDRLGKVRLQGACATGTSLVPLTTQQAMRNELIANLAGVAAEEIFTGESCSYAATDLAKTTELAAEMVGRFGMTESLVSMATGRTGQTKLVERVLADARTRKELEALLRNSKRDSMRLMLENRHVIIAVRDELLRKDRLSATEIQLVIDDARSRREDADEVLVDLRVATDRSRPVIGLAGN